MMSSPVGEYFVDWKIVGGDEDWSGQWLRVVDGEEEWLVCPILMLPRQLNGHLIWMELVRRPMSKAAFPQEFVKAFHCK